MLNIPIEVQDALREGALRKNYKMKVNDVDPDTGERTYLYTIDNDTLVSESVKIDERMVTGKELKFGLCEGSSIEFQYFDHPNINGKDVQVYCSVEYVDGNGDVDWYDIPMGWYTVDQCPMQWDTGIFKVTAYNKLKSDYLDAKANSLIAEISADSKQDDTISVNTITEALLDGYSVKAERSGIEIDYTAHESYVSVSNVKLLNRTGTYTLHFDDRYTSAETHSVGIWRSIDVENAKQYAEYVKRALNSFKKWIIDNFVNGQSLWDNDIIKYCLPTIFPVIYSNIYGTIEKRCIYVPKEYIMADVVTWDNKTYYLRSLENLYRITDYAGNIWMEVFTNAYVLDSNYDPIIQWTFDEIDDFDDSVPILWGITEATNIGNIEIGKNNLPDVTLRELQSAVYETLCQYGKLDRETDLFTGVELNQGGLYPADTLYPDNALYPSGNMEHPFPSTYSKLWTDTVGEQSFRYLIITYKAMENGQEVEKKLQRTVNEHGTTNYNMSDNWLFRNLVWTAEDVGAYADAMVLKMKDIRWFPFEMWCAGLPYVETGDAIEITDKQGNTHTSYVLTRTLDGIHNLQDTFINGELDIF